jgi:hypothetical protein
VKPQRPVPPERVLEVTERVGPGGEVLTPLDEASVHAVAAALHRLDVQAVAICLLHSFAYPLHERRVAEILRAALPEVAVTASVDVLPVVREYERSLATIMNAGVMPAVTVYVRRLERRLTDAAIEAPLLLMKSNGGIAGAATIERAPVLTVLSGPAAGVVGARDVAAAAGIGDLITVDIGGTSADISLLRGGRIDLTQRGRIGDWPLPMVDMVTIGAGGGSIARLSDGALTVGPASAGAAPGPACYGAGGEEPTVTDAHLVLGHLPASLLGGRMALDPALAAGAINARVAEPLGLSLHEAARGILAIADANMVGAIRVVSVERGHDPREFTLVPFGGAGPLHGCALADLLGITHVLVPRAPGVLCAEVLSHLAAAGCVGCGRGHVRGAGGAGPGVVRAGACGAGRSPDRARCPAALRGPGFRAAGRLAGNAGGGEGRVRRGTPGAQRLHAGGEGRAGHVAGGGRGRRPWAGASGARTRRRRGDRGLAQDARGRGTRRGARFRAPAPRSRRPVRRAGDRDAAGRDHAGGARLDRRGAGHRPFVAAA